MKILVGNHNLSNPGGSETYTFSLVQELLRRGVSVTVLAGAGKGGTLSDELSKIGAKCIFSSTAEKFDACLLSHSSSILRAKSAKGFKIQTCHGVFPPLEQPVKGMDSYVAISQEVKRHLIKLGHECEVILNGIDCKRYSPTQPIASKVKTILSLAQNEQANDIVRQACSDLSIEFIGHNKFKKWEWDMVPVINRADMVVSLGRGAYESMACGRNVIIFDHRKYANKDNLGDGFVDVGNVKRYIQNNCSGRYSMKSFTVEDFKTEILKYDEATGDALREFVVNHMSIEKQVDEYLKLIR